MLRFEQFNALAAIDKSENGRLLLKDLKKNMGADDEYNKVIAELLDAQLAAIDADEMLFVTEAGDKELEPYRVERAIIMAAGLGSRLMPVTINTPKPMVKVNGKKIIETLLDALVSVGIEEIYVVRGYLKENFQLLLDKYPMIKFVDNPQYATANSISSIYYAREHISNAYIMEADLYLSNPDILSRYQYKSNGLGIKAEKVEDWYFSAVDGRITRLNKYDVPADGESDLYTEVGISYVNGEDGKRLAKHIADVFESEGGTEVYWDQVQYDIHIDEYDFAIRECLREDIVEIDSFKELVEIDNTYAISL